MGRKPSNGGPSFRFNNSEVAEMESILQANDIQVPGRDDLAALAEKFSSMPERMDKGEVQIKQVWNWFQNRRYALRAKAGNLRSVLHSIRPNAAPSVQGEPNNVPENPPMEFEARSARDGAWYDVACFLSHRSLDTGAPEVYVRFAGFGPEEDEWLNVRKHIRQRSLPCESSECVAVLPGDLILCFQEGKEQALYFDAHVLDSQRRRHDARGCRCRFLVRYDHDQSEEIVPLRKICRRPETDYRLQQLHAEAAKVHQQRAASDIHFSSLGKGHAAAEPRKEQIKVDTRAGNTIGQTIGDLTLGTHSPSVNTPMINFNPDIPQPQHATETPLGTVATEMLPATDTQTFRPARSYPEVSLEITQAVGQVPATPQAESSQPAGSLELIGSQDMEETGPEGHKDTKEILETTQLQYPAEQIMPAAEGHDIGLCASATPTQASLPELTDINMESGER